MGVREDALCRTRRSKYLERGQQGRDFDDNETNLIATASNDDAERLLSEATEVVTMADEFL